MALLKIIYGKPYKMVFALKPISITFSVIIMMFLIFSCKKTSVIPDDRRCTNLIVNNQNAPLLGALQLDTIKYLFENNHLNYSNLQFYSYVSDSYGIIVRANQYVNHLKVFTDDITYAFNLNYAVEIIDSQRVVTKINLTNVPRLSASQIRWVFVKRLKEDDFYKNQSSNVDSMIEYGCINSEFGYYDLNAGVSFQPKKYTTAWRINPGNYEYPIAFVDDRTGNLITYDDGIIVDHW
jgi:hypothetical protein